jgi:thiosulfate reductase cytochrome b subunit
MKQLAYKHPLLIRWTHWVNFPILFLMIWSGLLIYWAYPAYRVGVGSVTVVHFFPKWFYALLQLDHQLAEGMAIHFVIAWIFILNGLLYAAFALRSGEWRSIWPDRHSLRDAWRVTLHDLGIIRSAPPSVKYNGGQKIAYTSIIIMGALSTVTGFAIYRPVQLAWLLRLLGGYQAVRMEHFILAAGFVLFFFVHVMQVIRAGWNNFRSMVAGFEIVDREGEAPHV